MLIALDKYSHASSTGDCIRVEIECGHGNIDTMDLLRKFAKQLIKSCFLHVESRYLVAEKRDDGYLGIEHLFHNS
jgi:hypothetical protein